MCIRDSLMSDRKCNGCGAFSKCLWSAIDNDEVMCSDFKWLKSQIDDAVDRLDSPELPCALTEEEIKNAIFFSNTI